MMVLKMTLEEGSDKGVIGQVAAGLSCVVE